MKKMKKTAEEFKHTKVVSESGNELFFDKEGKLIKEEPKQQTAVEFLISKLQWTYGQIDAFSQYVREAKEIEKEQIINAFNQGERYGWDTQASIENIDAMRNKIPFMSLEEWLKQFKNK